MLNFFAQIDENNFLVGVSQLSGEVNSENLVPISIEEYNTLFTQFYKPKYENGQWVEGATSEEIEAIENPKEPEDPFERIAQLEAENTLLKAQNQALADRTDFHEDVLEEIILTIYS